jgi:hypothetical protein
MIQYHPKQDLNPQPANQHPIRSMAPIQNEHCAICQLVVKNVNTPFNVQQFYKMNQNNGNSYMTVANAVVWLIAYLWTIKNVKILNKTFSLLFQVKLYDVLLGIICMHCIFRFSEMTVKSSAFGLL